MASAWVTTQEIVAGYLLAVVVSIPLALAVAYSRFMEQAVYPVIVFLQIVPKIAIAPLFIIWFGFGFTPKLLLVFLLSFFPIVVSSIAGFKAVDRDMMDFARTTGAGALAHVRRRSACRRRCRTSSPASRSARRSRPRQRSSPSSSRRTRDSATCCCSTTASSTRRWCSRRSSCCR